MNDDQPYAQRAWESALARAIDPEDDTPMDLRTHPDRDLVADLARLAAARDRSVDHEVRYVTITDDDLLRLLALVHFGDLR